MTISRTSCFGINGILENRYVSVPNILPRFWAIPKCVKPCSVSAVAPTLTTDRSTPAFPATSAALFIPEESV